MDSKERIEKALSVATDTKVFEIGQGASSFAPEVYRNFFPGRKAVVVADINTWPVLGELVYKLFFSAGIPVEKYIIGKKEFHAEWKYVEMVDKILDGDFAAAKEIEDDENHVEADAEKAFRTPSENYFVAVSVGSGVINDLCKLCSWHHGQSYITLPTATSVDGYSSYGASISYHNSKQTFSCPAPIAIIADIDVIAAAPMEMTAAGYADLAAKIPAGAEWMIADFAGADHIHPAAWHMLQDVLDAQLSNPEGVAARDPKAIADLFEGLTLSGFAMQAARSSRPASGCEHLVSHILDMTHHKFKGKLQSHGFQVAVGTIAMSAVFDEFFKLDLTKIDVDSLTAAWPSLEEEQARALEVFKNFPAPRLGYDQITLKYEGKDKVRKELSDLKAQWPALREKLQKQAYTYEKMRRLFEIVGAPYDPSMIGVTRRQLHDMFPIVQLMRPRYNILDLAKRGGFYDDIIEPVFAPGGVLDINKDIKF